MPGAAGRVWRGCRAFGGRGSGYGRALRTMMMVMERARRTDERSFQGPGAMSTASDATMAAAMSRISSAREREAPTLPVSSGPRALGAVRMSATVYARPASSVCLPSPGWNRAQSNVPSAVWGPMVALSILLVPISRLDANCGSHCHAGSGSRSGSASCQPMANGLDRLRQNELPAGAT